MINDHIKTTKELFEKRYQRINHADDFKSNRFSVREETSVHEFGYKVKVGNEVFKIVDFGNILAFIEKREREAFKLGGERVKKKYDELMDLFQMSDGRVIHFIAKMFGKRCEDNEIGCIICDMWFSYDEYVVSRESQQTTRENNIGETAKICAKITKGRMDGLTDSQLEDLVERAESELEKRSQEIMKTEKTEGDAKD